MKIIVFSTDLIPLPGLPTSGTALRTYGLAEGLRAHGHEVSISVPLTALEGFSRSSASGDLPTQTRRALDELKRTAFTFFNQAERVADAKPDLIICGHWPAMLLRTKPSQALAIDLAGPHLLERHYQGSPDQESAILAKLGVIATADYFIVSGPSQRLYFLSFMMRAGIDRPESRIATIPMPLNPTLPVRGSELSDAYPRFIFGGVFLPWQDPSWGLTRLVNQLEKRGRGTLKLIGGKHPNYNINQGTYAGLFSSLAKSKRTEVQPLLPFEQFISELSNADVALDLMSWNLERQLAVTIRSTTYLWAGLPVIYNDFADLGALIQHYDAGWLVPPGDEKALTEVCAQIFEDPNLVAKKGMNAQELARREFAWDRAVRPLLDFSGKRSASMLRETDAAVDYPEKTDRRVYRGHPVEQYFQSRVNGLSRVECKIATHGLTSFKPVSFHLSELEAQSVRPVANLEVSNLAKWNNQWLALDFDPIPDSAGKIYALRISCEDAAPEESISPWSLCWSPYPMRGLQYGDRMLSDEAICLRTTASVVPHA